jgi:hypothetical protein
MTHELAIEILEAMIESLTRRSLSAQERAAKARTQGARAGYEAAAQDYASKAEAFKMALEAMKGHCETCGAEVQRRYAALGLPMTPTVFPKVQSSLEAWGEARKEAIAAQDAFLKAEDAARDATFRDRGERRAALERAAQRMLRTQEAERAASRAVDAAAVSEIEEVEEA